ncbi:MAG: adenylate/guanylate cyclase domain-containing protein [Alphaproteobacteria bacterium]|nr:adenylate/guanylate cyclase domain-containing protein [Alphaproteobacteria bacterium]
MPDVNTTTHSSERPPTAAPPAIEPARNDRPAGDRVTADLPKRVRDAMRAHQDRSEILIGWVQLAVVGAFGTLYAISPKAFPPEVEFAPIPWVLGAYVVFTIARLVLAYRRGLTRLFLALSVVVDVALLLGTIWSFHLQYMQPAAFYLKAPTLLYLFIFIALRTLRFEPAYVVLAGVASAVGWVCMVAYALLFDPMAAPITRDYVFYLTSNAVLIGAEFDKIISILMVTAILAVAIVRARRLLVEAVRDSLANQELSRFFAQDVADRITDLDLKIEAGHGEMREAAVVMVDIRGFSQLATQITPDELMQILAEYQKTIVPVLQSHGGGIDKFLGDGILATFGATRVSDTAASDALLATEAVIEAAALWREERAARDVPAPRIGVAAAAGPIVFGAVGDASRLEYTVIGSAVNLAAKLEKHTKVEAVAGLTDEATRQAALRQGWKPKRAIENRPGRRVAGLDEPVDLVAFV